MTATFNDLHPRDRAGQFTEKPGTGTAAESDTDLYAPTTFRTFGEVEAEFENGEVHDDFADAREHALQVADAGYIGVISGTRSYDPDTIHDGMVEYLDESYEVSVLETEEDVRSWAWSAGMRPVEGNTDTYEDPDGYERLDGIREETTGFLFRPEVPAMDRLEGRTGMVGNLSEGDLFDANGKVREVLSVQMLEDDDIGADEDFGDGWVRIETDEDFLDFPVNDNIKTFQHKDG